MDTKHLNYILTIAKYRNMTKAAEQLFVSQSSLSQYLAKLEQELSAVLFVRKKSEMILTPAGQLYLEAAKKVIDIQQELYRNIASLNERGHFSIGVVSNFGLRMLSEILPKFQEHYPGFSVEISELSLPNLKKMMAENQLDLGITAADSQNDFEHPTILLREEEILFAIPRNHPYCIQNFNSSLSIDDLIFNFKNENILLSKKASSLRLISDRLFNSVHFKPSSYCETNSVLTTRNLICHNAGVGFVAESNSTQRSQIAYYHMSPPIYRKNLVIIGEKWRQGEPELYFINLLSDYFKTNTEHPYLAEKSSNVL